MLPWENQAARLPHSKHRDDMARTPPHKSKASKDVPLPGRDEDGKLAKGNTANPGGLTKSHRAMRAAFLDRLPTALALVDKWLDPDWADPEDRRLAFTTTIQYSLGKPVKPSEMTPLVEPKPIEGSAQDTAGLLAEVRALYAKAIGGLKGQQEAGDLAPDSIALLGRAGQDLGNLLKTEAEAARASKLGAMSVDELLEIICQHVPVDQVGEALKRRMDAREEKA